MLYEVITKLFNPENVYYEDNRTNVLGIINAKYFMISDFIFYNHRYVSTSIMNSKLSQKHIQSLKDLYLKTRITSYNVCYTKLLRIEARIARA